MKTLWIKIAYEKQNQQKMDKLPPFKVFVIMWAILLAYLTTNFIGKANINFIQFNYAWEEKRVLGIFKNVTIDSVSNDYLVLRTEGQKNKALNTDNTFCLKFNREAYFRATNIEADSTTIIFSGIKWINNVPQSNKQATKMEIINLPLIQPKGKKTMTIGDSQIIWRAGREFRKNIAQKGNVFFVGDKLDVYGYPYLGGVYDKTTVLAEKIQKASPAAYYILFFGAQDKNLDVATIKENTCQILQLLQNKTEAKTIYLVTLPPSTNTFFDSYNKGFNKNLADCSRKYNKTKIIDLYGFLGDKSDYLAEDAVHLNEKGYLFLNKLLLKEIR